MRTSGENVAALLENTGIGRKKGTLQKQRAIFCRKTIKSPFFHMALAKPGNLKLARIVARIVKEQLHYLHLLNQNNSVSLTLTNISNIFFKNF
ncbi:hypothetical protein [Deminuibacter soli]|uniref:Uncharacterized protein n=1 Tax=Deminuibacter soli TaxID=2291815 RepID=A0A3E1NKL6_9BACT|nr:hypothetical protein [Deminuibacter soli]RFM28485.1 hypothetical protein DXN05_06670 [Deminuibacter soli]